MADTQSQISKSQILYGLSNQEGGSFGYGGLPPEEALAHRALARKQQIANLLMTQGLEQSGTNHGQMVGRFYVPGSPLQNLAGLGQILAGALGSHHLDQQGEELQKQQGEMRANALQDYIKKTSAQPTFATAEGPGAPVDRPEAERQNFLAAAGPDAGASAIARGAPGLVQEGPAPTSPAPTMQAPDPAVSRVAQAQLATSTDPYLRQYAMAEAQRQGQAAEHGLQREFLASQNTENRQNRLDVAQQGFGKDMVLATMMGANKDQLAQMQQAHEKSLENLRGANRKDVAQIGADSRVDVAGMKQGVNRPMSATAQKELIQTEEEMQGAHAGMKSLDQALALNDQAMGFSGAGILAGAGSLLPESVRPKAIDATVELDNILTSGALPQLKAIFGGMPTEGERKVLLDVQGSSGKTPAVRKEIFERAKEALQNRLRFSGQKTEQLRKGTYFTGEGGLDTTVSPPGQSPSIAPPSATQGTVRKYNPATGKIE